MQPNSTATVCVTYQILYDWATYPDKSVYPEGIAHFGLAIGRNVLIYFEKSVRHDLLTKFYHSLRKSGFLILGKAETIIGKPSELFEPIMTKDRIYRRL